LAPRARRIRGVVGHTASPSFPSLLRHCARPTRPRGCSGGVGNGSRPFSSPAREDRAVALPRGPVR
jgi:hypothetical protein